MTVNKKIAGTLRLNLGFSVEITQTDSLKTNLSDSVISTENKTEHSADTAWLCWVEKPSISGIKIAAIF